MAGKAAKAKRAKDEEVRLARERLQGKHLRPDEIRERRRALGEFLMLLHEIDQETSATPTTPTTQEETADAKR